MSEPWYPIPVDPDPVCGHCGSASWDDEKAACSACGDTIYDVAERIAADTKRYATTGEPLRPRYGRPAEDSFVPPSWGRELAKRWERAQAIRDHQTQGGPE